MMMIMMSEGDSDEDDCVSDENDIDGYDNDDGGDVGDENDDDDDDDDDDENLGMGDAVRLPSVYGSPMAVLTCWE